MTREEQAVEFFSNGYNCAQSVFGAFSEDFGKCTAQSAVTISAGLVPRRK